MQGEHKTELKGMALQQQAVQLLSTASVLAWAETELEYWEEFR